MKQRKRLFLSEAVSFCVPIKKKKKKIVTAPPVNPELPYTKPPGLNAFQKVRCAQKAVGSKIPHTKTWLMHYWFGPLVALLWSLKTERAVSGRCVDFNLGPAAPTHS